MTMHNPLAAVLSKMMNAERLGKREIRVLQHSNLIKQALSILHEQGYIGGYHEQQDAKGSVLIVTLLGKLNDIGVITPNFTVSRDGYERFEKRYLPAKDFGVLILTTTNGLMTHIRAKEQGIGGKLLAYAY